ncbi:hypothetical protein GE09DRAFT_218634 [Coniochaeta sp. 2T2.1]|nr:hypothetical protein GE09DRAFT_218634 [Coniochaeta sp. 2T2.1]
MVMLERHERMADLGVQIAYWLMSQYMVYLNQILAKEIAPEILRHDGTSQKDVVPVDSTPLKPFAPEARRHPILPFVTALFTGLFLTIWLLLPVRFRSAVYWALERIGDKFAQHGLFDWANDPGHFQVLPFGLLLNIEASSEPVDNYGNEFRTLELIRQHTSIPVPKPLDIVPGPAFHLSHEERIYLPTESQTIRFMHTTRVPGHQLLKCLPFMTDRHAQELALQMRQYISELRAIPSMASPDMAICNTLGGPVAFLRPHRLYKPIAGYGDAYTQIEGIFADEDSFSQILRFPEDPGRRGHKIVFSHGCLAPKNIYVDHYVREDGTSGWKITGLVNWRRSGWFPDYWDHTRGLFGVSLLNPRLRTGRYYISDDSRLRYEDFLDAVFEVDELGDCGAGCRGTERAAGKGRRTRMDAGAHEEVGGETAAGG